MVKSDEKGLWYKHRPSLMLLIGGEHHIPLPQGTDDRAVGRGGGYGEKATRGTCFPPVGGIGEWTCHVTGSVLCIELGVDDVYGTDSCVKQLQPV